MYCLFLESYTSGCHRACHLHSVRVVVLGEDCGACHEEAVALQRLSGETSTGYMMVEAAGHVSESKGRD